MTLSPFKQMAYNSFGEKAKAAVDEDPSYSKMLLMAHFEELPEAYLAYTRMAFFIALIIGAVLTFVLSIIFGVLFVDDGLVGFLILAIVNIAVLYPVMFVTCWSMYPKHRDWTFIMMLATVGMLFLAMIIVFSVTSFSIGDWEGTSALLLMLPVFFVAMIPFFVFAGLHYGPVSKANREAREIDAYLPYAVNFISAMASANATPQKIFRSLAVQEDIYGAISRDAAWIYRDISVLGIDLISALKSAVHRAPSQKYKEFLQGVTSTLTSGGNIRNFFHNRAEHYMRENRKDQEDFIETLAFMAESYVVVAVAMPIFLMVIMVIMYWVSGEGMNVGESMLWLIIFVMLPAIHFGYIFAVKQMTPEI